MLGASLSGSCEHSSVCLSLGINEEKKTQMSLNHAYFRKKMETLLA